MSYHRFVNYYCERRAPGLLGEPLNASSNLSFFIAAYAAYRPLRHDKELSMAHVLCIAVAIVGAGSLLFHTAATEFTGWVDTLVILVYILLYLHGALRDFVHCHPLLSFTLSSSCGALLSASAIVLPRLYPALGFSVAYLPVAIIMGAVAALTACHHPHISRSLLGAGGVFTVSVAFRALDEPLCSRIRSGTHFVWHVLNGFVMYWLNRVYIEHRRAPNDDYQRIGNATNQLEM